MHAPGLQRAQRGAEPSSSTKQGGCKAKSRTWETEIPALIAWTGAVTSMLQSSFCHGHFSATWAKGKPLAAHSCPACLCTALQAGSSRDFCSQPCVKSSRCCPRLGCTPRSRGSCAGGGAVLRKLLGPRPEELSLVCGKRAQPRLCLQSGVGASAGSSSPGCPNEVPSTTSTAAARLKGVSPLSSSTPTQV